MSAKCQHAPARLIRGFTMLEILIALLVLSIGLLGVAGLQTMGLRYSQSAYVRSQVTALVDDLADRMRANPGGVINGAYDNFGTASTLPTDPGCIASANGCTPANLAIYDKLQWVALVKGRLPEGVTAKVERIATTNDFDITLSWTDVAITSGSMTQTLKVRVQL